MVKCLITSILKSGIICIKELPYAPGMDLSIFNFGYFSSFEAKRGIRFGMERKC